VALASKNKRACLKENLIVMDFDRLAFGQQGFVARQLLTDAHVFLLVGLGV
jgi:hypothetical protein